MAKLLKISGAHMGVSFKIFAASGLTFGSITFGPSTSPKMRKPRIKNAIPPAMVAAKSFISIDKLLKGNYQKPLTDVGFNRWNLLEFSTQVNGLR